MDSASEEDRVDRRMLRHVAVAPMRGIVHHTPWPRKLSMPAHQCLPGQDPAWDTISPSRSRMMIEQSKRLAEMDEHRRANV
jgi:hypothetical protein